MDEPEYEQLEASRGLRPWRDVAQECISSWNLASTLCREFWGDSEHLKEQLARCSPLIPKGLGPQELLTLKTAAWLMMKYQLESGGEAWKMVIGGEHWTVAEAKYEVAKRALEASRNR